MNETTEPRKHRALATTWVITLAGSIFFAFCLLAVGAVAWNVLSGRPVKTQITWQTVLVLIMSAWLTVTVRMRTAQFALGLLSVGIASRVVLALLHVSVLVQTVNAEVVRVVELVIMIGFCICMPYYWLKDRIKHV